MRMPGRRVRAVAGWLLALVLMVGCGSAGTSGAGAALPTPPGEAAGTPPSGIAGRLKVVATFSILGDLVANVGGDRITLRTLVGPGGDAHTFEPSPEDGVALAEAALIFENGVGFEPWLDKLYSASGSRARRVVVTEKIAPLPVGTGDEHAHAEEQGHDGEVAGEHGAGEHGEFDPHVWHDVANAMLMVETIRDALVQADPANADVYRTNAETYLAELKELDAFIVAQTQALPQARRKLVTSHDTFAYFARRYGFEIVGTALGAATTEAADPSAGEIARLVEEIRAAGMPVIFAENVHNPGLMERIAAEAGVKLGPTLYTDALGAPGSDGETYLKLMRYNVTTLVTALGS
jgi:zinc/manganese transport system substrate-binding protein